MKTLESIMRFNAGEGKNTSQRKCDDCGVLEGDTDSENGSEILLAEIYVSSKKKLLCQVCQKEYSINQEKSVMKKLIKYLASMFGVFIIVLIASGNSLAQPNLPIAPSQAPIDGGLGLLAAAGGAYAYKKLKTRKD